MRLKSIGIRRKQGSRHDHRRLIIVDQGLNTLGGHHSEYTLTLAQEAAPRLPVSILAHRQCTIAAPDGIRLVPTFRFEWTQSQRASVSADDDPTASFSTRLFLADLRRGLGQIGASAADHVFIHTIGFAEIEDLLTMVMTTERDRLPAFHVLLRRDLDECGDDDDCWRFAAYVRAFAELGYWPNRVRFYADTEQLRDQYAQASEVPFTILPVPFDEGALRDALRDRSAKAASDPLVVGYLGDARLEKGYQFLPALAEALLPSHLATGKARLRLQSNCNLPGSEPGIASFREALARFDPDHVALLDAPMAGTEYYRQLAELDIVVLPYLAERYRRRSSGIFVQAVAAGKIVVVPRGTTMWAEAQRAGLDSCIPFDGRSDLADAVTIAIDRHAALCGAAQAAGAAALSRNSAATLLDQLLDPAPEFPKEAAARAAAPLVLHIVDGRDRDPAPLQRSPLSVLRDAGCRIVSILALGAGPAAAELPSLIERNYDYWRDSGSGFSWLVYGMQPQRSAPPDLEGALQGARQLSVPETLQGVLATVDPDLVWTDSLALAPFIELLGLAGRAPVICETTGLRSLAEAVAGDGAVRAEALAAELKWLCRMRGVLPFGLLDAASIIAVPGGPALLAIAGGEPTAADLLFVAGADPEHQASFAWFCRSIYDPFLLAAGVTLSLGGALGRAGWEHSVARHVANTVVVAGEVDSAEAARRAAHTLILPIVERAGGELADLAAWAGRLAEPPFGKTVACFSDPAAFAARLRRQLGEKAIDEDAAWRHMLPPRLTPFAARTRQPRGGGDPPSAAPVAASPATSQPDDDAAAEEYWLPDPLREYVMDRFGDEAVRFLREVMAILSRHAAAPQRFAASRDCRDLIERVRRAAVDPEPDQAVDVSIVLTVRRGPAFALTCLLSLLHWLPRHRIEILLALEPAAVPDAEVLAGLGGRIRYLPRAGDLDLLRVCNLAGQQARGRYLAFLGDDAIVLPGWLDGLIAMLDGDAQIGCVGSKILEASGILEEAGGIVWRDGSTEGYGRGEDPRQPQFNYAKEVDFCSALAIALRKAAWDAAGGFDPAYAEEGGAEADLALRLRALGYRTHYQPYSEVIRYGIAAAAHPAQTGNEVLNRRWHQTLHASHFVKGANIFAARDRSGARPHLLVVDHYIPQWDRDAGSRAIYQFMKLFVAQGFQITFWPDNLNPDQRYIRSLHDLGIEVIYSPRFADRFTDWVQQNGRHLTYACLSRPHIAVKYIAALRRHATCEILYYGHDVHWQRLEAEHAIAGGAALGDSRGMRELEESLWRQSDVVLYPTRQECALVTQTVPGKRVCEMPLLIYGDAAGQSGPEAGRDPFHLLFVGGFGHPPNTDAVQWLVREVWPILRARDARFRLTIAGTDPPPEIGALASPEIRLTGHLDDAALAELYASVGCAVIPLRYGGGLKGKLLESFAHGVPVVSTTAGLHGVDRGDDLAFVADSAIQFAAQVVEACTNREAAAIKVHNALCFISRRFSRAAAVAALAEHIVEFRG